MAAIATLFLLLYPVCVSCNLCTSSSWMVFDNATKNCNCGDNICHVVNCTSKEVFVLQCYAMTYSEEYNTTVVRS